MHTCLREGAARPHRYDVILLSAGLLFACAEKQDGSSAAALEGSRIRAQEARSLQLSGDFDGARAVLEAHRETFRAAGSEGEARYWLEWGRTFVSHRHAPDLLGPEALDAARDAYERSRRISRASGHDALRVDALHMMAFVDSSPEEQEAWTRRALKVALASRQSEARRWEASLRSNLGEALYDLGRFEPALVEFQSALALRQAQGAPAPALRDAEWHVARALRQLGHTQRALSLQQRISAEAWKADAPRPYFYEELALLYAAVGDEARAEHFAEHGRALRGPGPH
ncbi:MAG: hypothetical protein AAFU79_09600 [Myxococcota bacterium]